MKTNSSENFEMENLINSMYEQNLYPGLFMSSFVNSLRWLKSPWTEFKDDAPHFIFIIQISRTQQYLMKNLKTLSGQMENLIGINFINIHFQFLCNWKDDWKRDLIKRLRRKGLERCVKDIFSDIISGIIFRYNFWDFI